MELRRWREFCLCAKDAALFPPDALPETELFAPLVLLVRRDPLVSRGWAFLQSIDELYEPEDERLLLPVSPSAAPEALRRFVVAHGATLLNTAFENAFPFLAAKKKRTGLRVTVIGLGDVGGTLLTALKLLGGGVIAELRIYDPNEALCLRYEMELNQILPPDGEAPPCVTLCTNDTLFDCDLLLFTASKRVPPVGAAVEDVRMAQYAQNRAMLAAYAQRAKGFQGLFCQISDPVDLLARTVFLQSNGGGTGRFDGLLPEQVQGFGLGVMAARAAYWAHREGINFSEGRVFGPHGNGLVVANHPTDYDAELSARLTRLTVEANLRVRELGFKPYLAPAISSAAVSILRLLRGQTHYGAVPLGGVYFGCRCRMSAQGVSVVREPLSPALFERLRKTRQTLKELSDD